MRADINDTNIEIMFASKAMVARATKKKRRTLVEVYEWVIVTESNG
jgi:hypothetical protein